MPRGSKPGERRGGRKAGSPNKLSTAVKDAIVRAFNEAGGHKYLKTIAATHPAVFCQLVGKIIPLEVTGANGGPIQYVPVATGIGREPGDDRAG